MATEPVGAVKKKKKIEKMKQFLSFPLYAALSLKCFPEDADGRH